MRLKQAKASRARVALGLTSLQSLAKFKLPQRSDVARILRFGAQSRAPRLVPQEALADEGM